MLEERIEAFNAKIESLMENDADLSASGVATAIALLVAMNFDTLKAIPAALKARKADNG